MALLHLHLATSLHAGDAEEHSSHLRHALTLLTPSLHHLNTHRSTFLCGAAGPLALGAVVHAHLGNMEDASTCVTRLKELYVKNKPSFAKLPSELLFGHAGYLYALLFVNCYLPSAVENSLIEEVCAAFLLVLQVILSSLFSSPRWQHCCWTQGYVVVSLAYPHHSCTPGMGSTTLGQPMDWLAS